MNLHFKEPVRKVHPKLKSMKLNKLDDSSVSNKISKLESRESLAKAAEAARLDESYQKGLQVGINEGKSEAHKEFKLALGTLQSVFEHHHKLERELLNEIENTVLKLAMKIAEKVIQKEVQADEEIICNVVQKAVAMLNDTNSVKVKINPKDMTIIQENWDDIKKTFRNIEKWKLESSTLVDRGGCLVETPNETIDARIQSQLELIDSILCEGFKDASNG